MHCTVLLVLNRVYPVWHWVHVLEVEHDKQFNGHPFTQVAVVVFKKNPYPQEVQFAGFWALRQVRQFELQDMQLVTLKNVFG